MIKYTIMFSRCENSRFGYKDRLNFPLAKTDCLATGIANKDKDEKLVSGQFSCGEAPQNPIDVPVNKITDADALFRSVIRIKLQCFKTGICPFLDPGKVQRIIDPKS